MARAKGRIQKATDVHRSNAECHKKAKLNIRTYNLRVEDYVIDRALTPP